jgi:hypothetical protein
MTFTEAAMEILRRAGKPLHVKEITETAIKENLLSHVGQTPEETMTARLTAMAKAEVDRRIVAVEAGTFALAEWGAAPNPAALEPAPEEQHDESEALRPRERHPRATRALGRGRGGEDEGRRKRRFPPPAEVAHEWLTERGQPATLDELALGLREKDLIAEGLARDVASLQAALAEDNRRRTEAGRKPVFVWSGSRVSLSEMVPPDVAAEPLGPPVGRERPAPFVPLAASAPLTEAEQAAHAGVQALHRKLREVPAPAFERAALALLEKMGYRDLRIAKRKSEGPLYTARRRMGVGDIRFAVRLVRGRDVGRNEVQEMRRDLANHGAQVGTLVTAGDVRRDAVAEAGAAGQPPLILYGGRQIAEKLVSKGIGVKVQTVEVPFIDETWFAALPREEAAGPERGEREGEEEGAPVGEGEGGFTAGEGGERDGGRRRRRRRGRGRGRERSGEAGPRAQGAPPSAEGGGAPPSQSPSTSPSDDAPRAETSSSASDAPAASAPASAPSAESSSPASDGPPEG